MITKTEMISRIRSFVIRFNKDGKLIYNDNGDYLDIDRFGNVTDHYKGKDRMNNRKISTFTVNELYILMINTGKYIEQHRNDPVPETDKIDPDPEGSEESEQDEKPILWYKVRCSLYDEDLGIRKWDDVVDFIQKNPECDYIISSRRDSIFRGVGYYYDNGSIYDVRKSYRK